MKQEYEKKEQMENLEGDGILFWNYYIFCKAAKFPGTDKTVMLAKGVIALPAVLAFHAGHQGNAGYPVPGFHFGYAFPYRFHCP